MMGDQVMTPEEQLELLTRFLASDAVRDRPEGIQRDQDNLIRRCLVEGELSLAMSLWAVMAIRSMGLAHESASILLSAYSSRDVRSRARSVLGEDRTN